MNNFRENSSDDMYRKFKEFMQWSDRNNNRTIRSSYEDHFDEYRAKDIVSEMYHYENGDKYIGEKYPIEKAKEVLYAYKMMLPDHVTCTDVYIALNAQFHDYHALFKKWFGKNVDNNIIESAMSFWFKDDDYKKDSKIWNYFN